MSTVIEETPVDTNNILEVRRRPTKAQAVQFTGKNGKEIVAFLRAKREDLTYRNGGSYVKINPVEVAGVTYPGSNIRKGDWVVVEDDYKELHVLPAAEFERVFSIKKSQ